MKLYRPSTGTEGFMFEAKFCDNCINDDPDDGCDIIFSSMCHDIDEPGYPEEFTFDKDGKPTCLKFIEYKPKVK